MTTAKVIERARDDEDANLKPPTHTVYTPAWRPDWDEETGDIVAGKFSAWLAVGYAWKDDSGGLILDIHSRPVNHEATATGFLISVPVGAPPPAPLTMTRDEYLDQQYGTYDAHPGQ